MCGISGIVTFDGSLVDASDIRTMNDAIVHRGPDDEGVFVEGGLGLGHRRLAILDLSKDGHQPMTRSSSGLVIVFNGEIYNYLEIRAELHELGHVFETGTDTEVILAAYAQWGEACVKKFNGMWSFALFDRSNNRLFCSRDRFGVKPFYYVRTAERLVFGSEIKQLLPYLTSVSANRRKLVEYLMSDFSEHDDETFFDGVMKLPQSTNMVIDLVGGEQRTERFYDVHRHDDMMSRNFDDAKEAYQQALQRAVELRLRSDVEVGSCLSGGLDSSTVCALAAPSYVAASGNKLNAIHAKSTERETDESEYAEAVADAAGLRLNVIEPSEEDFITHIDEVVYTQEEPFGGPSIFMQYFVMRRAKELGCKVMLDGQGGDETLLGYEKYYPAAYLEVWKQHGIVDAVKAAVASWRNNARMSPIWILKFLIGANFPRLRRSYIRRRAPFVRRECIPPMRFLYDLTRAYRDVFLLQHTEIYSTNLPILLRYEDKNSMRHSVEARLPFIDYLALECALNTDVMHKISRGWTKYLLRRIIDGLLPSHVVWRKSKLGFNAPDNIWLKAYGAEMREEVQGSRLLAELTDSRQMVEMFDGLDPRLKWRLFNIACWERVYAVS